MPPPTDHRRSRFADAPVRVHRHPAGDEHDRVAVEEPLEIRIDDGDGAQPVAITLRTPGHDEELALGFLFTEAVIGGAPEVARVEATGPAAPGSGLRNTLEVSLADGVEFDAERLARHFFTASSCGVCGKRALEALAVQRHHDPREGRLRIEAQRLLELPERLRQDQAVFADTGALHAAASFDAGGSLLCLREDVGRHNALDKLIGEALRRDDLPWPDRGIVVSGRASFELVQKAAMVGCPLLAAVGGPSSLAVELARDTGMTLVGFLRDGRFNVYSSPERILGLGD